MLTPMGEVLLISLALSFLLAGLYRVLTKPEEIRKIKQDMEFHKKKANEAQKAGRTEEAKKHTNDMMKCSQKQMGQSMKPMLASMIIFFILLGWLASAYGAVIVPANDPTFNYRGTAYSTEFISNGELSEVAVDFNNDGTFSPAETHQAGDIFKGEDVYWQVSFYEADDGSEGANFDMLLAKSPIAIPYVGKYLNWFWWYLIIVFPANLVFRKLLGVE